MQTRQALKIAALLTLGHAPMTWPAAPVRQAAWRRGLNTALMALAVSGLAGCALGPIAVSTLPGIEKDQLGEALATFTVSCEAFDRLKPGQAVVPAYTGARGPESDPVRVKAICNEARDLLARQPDNAQVLAFLDQHFVAYPMASAASPGLMTAYYEPVIPISKTKTPTLNYPLYGVPPSLKPTQPWFTRQEIETGVADEALKDVILAYTTRWSAYVLGIQGSGIGREENGNEFMIQYADKNHRAYTGLGSILISRGEVPKDRMSMTVLENWLASHSQEAQDTLYWKNESYVFFKMSGEKPAPDRLGPPGAMALKRGLTPQRSAAVDWEFYTPGLPVYVVGTVGRQIPISRLLIAQDRGGAIKTGKKLDLFLGRGEAEKTLAGNTADPTLQLWSLDFRRPVANADAAQ